MNQKIAARDASVRNSDIQISIVIEIEPAGGNGPDVASDACLDCNVFELTAAKIPVQMIGSHACNEEIRPSVVVETTRDQMSRA